MDGASMMVRITAIHAPPLLEYWPPPILYPTLSAIGYGIGSTSPALVGVSVEMSLVTSLIGSTVVASLISGITSAVVARRRAAVDRDLSRRRGEIERDLAARRAGVDERLKRLEGELAEQKVRLDNKTIFAAEEAVVRFLEFEYSGSDGRSFHFIRHRLRGFEDNELRRLLVRAGAVQFTDDAGRERWALWNRNLHLVERTKKENADLGVAPPDRG